MIMVGNKQTVRLITLLIPLVNFTVTNLLETLNTSYVSCRMKKEAVMHPTPRRRKDLHQ